MISKNTNSEIGSVHWFNTLISYIKHVGEYISEDTPPDENLRVWGKNVHEYCDELINHFNDLNKRKVNISFTGNDIENKEAFTEAMVKMINKAIEQSSIKQ